MTALPTPAATPTRLDRLLSLRPRELWKFLSTQDLGFWALIAYLFFEYVRPQVLYPALAFAPWAQISLGLAILGWLLSGKGFGVPSGINWILLVYCAVVLASSLQSANVDAARERWSLFYNWVVIYFLIVSITRTPERVAVFLMTWLLWNLYMSQGAARQWALRGFTFSTWGVLGAPGWFHNSGEFGIEMCIFLPIAWHFYLAAKPHLPNKWWHAGVLLMPITAIMGIMGSSSRGAQLGLACVFLWALMRSKKRVRALFGLAIVGALTWAVLPEEQKTRFTDMGSDSTSTRRVTYWKAGLEMARENPLLGIGYGNWLSHYTRNYSDPQQKIEFVLGEAQLPHNLFIEALAELGYVGFAVLLMLIIGTWVVNYRTRKLARAGPVPNAFIEQIAYGLDGALVGLIVSGFFVTVLYYPFLWINLSFTVALSGAARHHVRHAAGLQRGAAPAAAAATAAASPRAGWRPPRRR